jgi:hypothetical protein
MNTASQDLNPLHCIAEVASRKARMGTHSLLVDDRPVSMPSGREAPPRTSSLREWTCLHGLVSGKWTDRKMSGT